MGFINDIRKNKYLYLLALPAMIYLIIFAYLPMFGHLIAFEDFNVKKGLFGSPFVGLKHFKFFFLGDYWMKVTWNTIYLNVLQIFFGTVITVASAIFLNEIRSVYYKKISQSLMFLPYFISWVVVAYMVQAMLSTKEGLINNLLVSLGMERVAWYSNPNYWPAIITFIHIWKSMGRGAIIYLAVITGLGNEYYESARIDGANRFQQIWHITLPLLKPTIVMMTLLSIGNIFYGDFGLIYPIVGDNGVLFPTTDVIDTYAYRGLRQNFAGSAAIVLWQSLMGLICIVGANWVTKRIDKDLSLW